MAEAGQDHAAATPAISTASIGVRAAASAVSSAPAARHAPSSVRSTRAFRLSHPDAQASGLVVLQLEQVQHLKCRRPAISTSTPSAAAIRPIGHHLRRSFAAAWRGCSSRKRRATALNWPGESA